jgi:alpha-1,3-rhamnosyl/mannosyltransferase
VPLPIALDYRPALLSRAGIGRATRELAAALARRPELTVHLFGHSLAAARVATQVPQGARLHRWPIPGRFLPQLSRLGWPAERLAGDVGVFHWTDYVHPPVGAARALLTLHDLAFLRNRDWHGPAAAGLAARTTAALRQAAAVVVPSRATGDDLRQQLDFTGPVHVVPFGADHLPETIAAPHPLAGRAFVLCLGTLEPRKNHLGLLAAWQRLPAPRPLLCLVGAIGWQCADIVAAVRSAQQRGELRWWPALRDAAMLPLLAHASLLVYPSLWEGFGFPPLEAMRLGVPVLAHDSAALRELGDGAVALVDATDPAALADGIASLLQDRSRRQALQTAGRARAAQFRWQACAAAHAAIYQELQP